MTNRLKERLRLDAQRFFAVGTAGVKPEPFTDRGYFLAAAEWRRRWRALALDDVDLAAHELRVSSQNGEDGVIAEVLRRTGCSSHPFFVEFGIQQGSEGNCVALADHLGWSGLFIEAASEYFEQLRRKYQWSDVQTLHAFVTPDNVADLFAQAGVPTDFDVLSIDIDGGEYWIWRALRNYRPRLVVTEFNSGLPPTERLTVPPDYVGADGTSYFGASLGALRALAEERGYRYVYTELTGVNAFFVRRDLPGTWLEEPARRGPNHHLRSWGHARDERQREYERDPPR